jgi:hypothetical protein
MKEELCFSCPYYRPASGEIGKRYCARNLFDETKPHLQPKLDRNCMVIKPPHCWMLLDRRGQQTYNKHTP